MNPLMLNGEIERANHRFNSWEAELRSLLWVALLLAALCIFSASDLFLHLTRTGRVVVWAVLMAGLVGTVVHAALIMRRRRSVNAVAAIIENAFPKLDNHLINYLQFSASPASSTFQGEYVRRGVPEWGGVELSEMRNRRQRLAWYAVALAAILLVTAPFYFVGEAWNRAVRRVINPFSNLAPKTVATLLSVQPGSTNVVRGEELLLSCRATGRNGQRVELDLWPSDDKSSTMLLGRITGNGEEEFAYRMSKVVAALDYRVRAGDAPPSDRYTVNVLPPLAFSSIRLDVTPPAYTGRPATNFDGLAEKIELPQGATVKLTAQCNQALASAHIVLDRDPPQPLVPSADAGTWSDTMVISSGRVINLTVADLRGAGLNTQIKYKLIPDKAPAIRVIAPLGKSVLAAGAVPRIEFEVGDEYGLSRVLLVRGDRSENTAGQGETLREWTLQGDQALTTNWIGKPADVIPNTVFRLVAYDNAGPGAPHRAISEPIVFESGTAEALDQEERKSAAAIEKLLAGILQLQKTNLGQTEKLRAAPTTATPEQWQEVLARQTEIRRMAGEILKNPRRPLGPLTEGIQRAFGSVMREVLDVLGRIPGSAGDEKTRVAGRAIELEQTILRLLTLSEMAYEKVQQHQEVTGLLAMLDALVEGQHELLTASQSGAKRQTAAQPALAQQQDKLAADLATFLDFCKRESEKIKQTDEEFSKVVLKGAEVAESKKIHADMLTAAEHIENAGWAQAVPVQTRALASLKEIQAMFNAWRMDEAKDRAQQLQEMIDRNQDRLDKLLNLETNIVEALRALESQKDKSKKEYDETLEDLEELKADMSQVALKIANDLQLFPELPVGNDLVEDVNQIFEEMKQVPGSAAAEVKELNLQKEDFILDLLSMAAKRIDDMETWLTAKPDAVKRNIESFDKAELPNITVMPMPAELNDIIGDLMEQQEELKDEADDSAGNQGAADGAFGWDIAEGEWTSYSAKGKSGNETPEHKEQDGRSGVGREGMSDGENVAGSGKINEGDKNIEKRMTRDSSQAGQIQEEDHAKAKATGGGKSAGYSEERGMAGMGPRRDSPVNTESDLGLQAMLRRDSEAIYAQASLQHIRTGQLGKAIHHMRQAEDALIKGYPIRQVKEFQRRAIMALKETQTELDSGFSDVAIKGNIRRDSANDDQVASTADEAPAQYRDLVSEYFKALGEAR